MGKIQVDLVSVEMGCKQVGSGSTILQVFGDFLGCFGVFFELFNEGKVAFIFYRPLGY